MRLILKTLALALSMVWVNGVAMAEDDAAWPQWRGPSRDGQVSALEWQSSLKDEALKPLWGVDLGKSYSGTIVGGSRVFTTETVNEAEEVVRAFDRKTGKELWKVGWPATFQVIPMGRVRGNWIRATPAYDDGRLMSRACVITSRASTRRAGKLFGM